MNIFKIKYLLFVMFIVFIGLNMYIYSKNKPDKDAEYKLTDAKIILILNTNSTTDRGIWHHRHSMFFVKTLVRKKEFIDLFIKNGWQIKNDNPLKMTKGSVILEAKIDKKDIGGLELNISKGDRSKIINNEYINNFYLMNIDTSKTKTILDLKDFI